MHIRLISPSAPIVAFCPKRLARSVDALTRLGHTVTLGAHVSALTGFTAGTIQDRLQDLQDAFLDPSVDVVMATIGGYNANDLLDGIDYERLRGITKPFIGYSDITILLHVLFERSGIPAIMGPMALPQWGEYPEPQPFTTASFEQILRGLGTGTSYEAPVSAQWTEEFLRWDSEDTRLRTMEANPGWMVLRAGEGTGPLRAGNLRCLLTMAGTAYQPTLSGTVLCLEDDDEESLATVQRMLQHAKQVGYLRDIRGLMFGRFQKKSDVSPQELRAIVDRVLPDAGIPIVMGIDVGHTDPQLSLPFGAQATLTAGSASRLVIKL